MGQNYPPERINVLFPPKSGEEQNIGLHQWHTQESAKGGEGTTGTVGLKPPNVRGQGVLGATPLAANNFL